VLAALPSREAHLAGATPFPLPPKPSPWNRLRRSCVLITSPLTPKRYSRLMLESPCS